MYVVYENEGPFAGRIISTISGPDKSYGPEVLDKNGQHWIFVNGRTTIDPSIEYIDTETKQLLSAVPMLLNVSKTEIIANGIDESIVEGIPPNASVTVFCNGQFLSSHLTNDDGKIEINSDAEAEFEIRVSCFKFRNSNVFIKAVGKNDENQSETNSERKTIVE